LLLSNASNLDIYNVLRKGAVLFLKYFKSLYLNSTY
jgi:hypothetical protein